MLRTLQRELARQRGLIRNPQYENRRQRDVHSTLPRKDWMALVAACRMLLTRSCCNSGKMLKTPNLRPRLLHLLPRINEQGVAEEKVKKGAELALWVPIRTLLQSYNYMLESDTKVTLEPVKSFAKTNNIVTISKKMTKQELFDAIMLAMSLKGLRGYLIAPAAPRPEAAVVAPSAVAGAARDLG